MRWTISNRLQRHDAFISMNQPPEERRQFARHDVAQPITMSLPAVHELQLLDVCRSGVLFACSRRRHIGEQVRISVLVAGEPFSASIRIVREAVGGPAQRAGSRCYGAVFVEIDETSRRTLQRFLASGPLSTIES